ncbi:GNAT family N-acetyltransferase [Gordonia sp. CPCC 205333]|uniref:GNAT family N-acetyltransferase n=1 Tax=Gordonia sp. CPCC 205333 TaxID=3140790 RepID=UPI003AF405B1
MADVVSELSAVRHGIALYRFGPEFAADSFAHLTPSLTRYMTWDPPASMAAFEPIWRRWVDQRSAGTDFVFAIVDPVSGEFLGQVGIHQADEAVPEFGIWIREDRHGRGYGRRAVAAARDWANEQRSDIIAFRYPVVEENTASRRIAEGLGGVSVDRYANDGKQTVVYQIPVD